MPVKVVIKRVFKDPDFTKISQMLVRARTNAMEHDGYISSETLVGYEDPNEVVVLSMWENKVDWDRYKDSGPRRELEEAFEAKMNGNTQYRVYKLGLSKP